MKKYGVIVWNNDDFLESNLSILSKTLAFINTEIYRRIHCVTIDHISFDYYYQYHKKLQKLMKIFVGHKL